MLFLNSLNIAKKCNYSSKDYEPLMSVQLLLLLCYSICLTVFHFVFREEIFSLFEGYKKIELKDAIREFEGILEPAEVQEVGRRLT